MATMGSRMGSRRVVRSLSAMSVMVVACGHAMAGSPGAGFNYADFSSTAGLALNNHAVQTGSFLDLNGVIQRGSSSGSVWHVDQQNISLGFTTDFRFRIQDVFGQGGGGFAFVVHNSNSGPGGTASFGTSALGAAGGSLGYGSNVSLGGTNPGINNSVALEFDLYTFVPKGTSPQDFVGDHVALYNWGTAGENPLASNAINHATPAGGSAWENVSDGGEYDVRITYVPGLYEVFIKRASDAVFGPAVMSTLINLSTAITLDNSVGDGVGRAWVGFTSGSGGIQDFERHQILSWEFAGNIIPSPGALALLALGGVVGVRRRR